MAPKYALFERERRWLVDDATCPLYAGARHAVIADRYLTDTRFRLRRVTDSESGDVILKLTKKYLAADFLARPIVTAYLTESEYEVFARLPGQNLLKRRYVVDGFCVDRFVTPAGLPTIAEIERPSAAALAEILPPPWAAAEISGDARYDGAVLAAAHSAGPRR